MGQYKASDFGYEFASFPPATATAPSADEAVEEATPLVTNPGSDEAALPGPSGNPDGTSDRYILYKDNEEGKAACTRSYRPKADLSAESYLRSGSGDGGHDELSYAGGACCCLASVLLVSGGVIMVYERFGTDKPLLLAGAALLVAAAGTCLCGCVALCCDPGGSKEAGGFVEMLGGGRENGPADDPGFKEVKLRMRRLNERYERGGEMAEKALDRVRMDVLEGAEEKIAAATKKEAASKKKAEASAAKDLRKRVADDLEQGTPVRTIRRTLRPTLFHIHFEGDTNVSNLELLRKQVSLVVRLAVPGKDVCCVAITSPGGSVTAYGAAASHLVRIRKAGVRLTACVDAVAASGGYMMAAVADEICAAPFAIVGSIGVVTYIPNVQRFLNKHDIDAYLMTAGKHKRTIDVIGEVTEEGKQKLTEELEDIHTAFKDHVALARPQLRDRINEVATGEHWLAVQAKERGLVDKIMTCDEFLESQAGAFEIIEILEVTQKKKGIAGVFDDHAGLLGRLGRVVNKLWGAVEVPGRRQLPMAVHV